MDPLGLPPGRWVKQKGVDVWIPDEIAPPPAPAARRPPKDAIAAVSQSIDWPQEELNAAHARYFRGLRDAATIAGNREWHRRYNKRRREAQKALREQG